MAPASSVADLRVEWRESYSLHTSLPVVATAQQEPTGHQRLGQGILAQLLRDLGYRDSNDHPITPCRFALASPQEQKRRIRAARDVREGRHRLALDLLALSPAAERRVAALVERCATTALH